MKLFSFWAAVPQVLICILFIKWQEEMVNEYLHVHCSTIRFPNEDSLDLGVFANLNFKVNRLCY